MYNVRATPRAAGSVYADVSMDIADGIVNAAPVLKGQNV